jgi:hypothetical protein
MPLKIRLKHALLAAALFTTISHAHAASAIAGFKTDVANIGWEDHAKTLAEAKRNAIAECSARARKIGVAPGECRIWAATSHPGYWAIFNQADGGVSWGFSSHSQQEATNKAYDTCMKDSTCSETATITWHDDGSGRANPDIPKGRYISSYDYGTRVMTHTYANGKTVRFTPCTNNDGSPFDNADGSCNGFDFRNHPYGYIEVTPPH